MEYNGDFKYDVKLGQLGENLVGHLFSEAKIEVKRDSWTSITGNLAVEYKCRGNFSGISVTEADWWAFVLAGGLEDSIVLMVRTDKLKKLCRKYYDLGRIKAMGDQNKSMAILIPWRELLC